MGSSGRNRSEADTVLNLAGRCYDAATDPSLWPSFLERYADAIGGEAAILFASVVNPTPTLELAAMTRFDPEQYRAHLSGRMTRQGTSVPWYSFNNRISRRRNGSQERRRPGSLLRRGWALEAGWIECSHGTLTADRVARRGLGHVDFERT